MQAVVCLNNSVSAAFCAAQFLLFNSVQDSLGYGFIPAFRQARSKQKSDRAVLLHRLVFTSVLRLRHFRNTGQNCYWALIDADMRHILLLLFVFVWFVVANRSSRETSVVI